MEKILLSLFCLLLITKTEAQGMPCWYDSLIQRNYDSISNFKQEKRMFFESFPKNTFNPKDFLDVYIDLLYLSAE